MKNLDLDVFYLKIKKSKEFKIFILSFPVVFFSFLTDSFFITPYSDDLVILGHELNFLIRQYKLFAPLIDSIILSGYRSPAIINVIYVSLIIVTLILSFKLIFKSYEIVKNNKLINDVFLVLAISLGGSFFYFLVAHEHTKVIIIFSGFLSVFALYFLSSNKIQVKIFSFIMLFLSCGIYLPSICFSIVVSIFSFFNTLYESHHKEFNFFLKKEFKKFILRILTIFFSAFLFLAFYYLIQNIHLFNIDYISNNSFISLNRIHNNLLRSFQSSLNFFMWKGVMDYYVATLYKLLFFGFLITFTIKIFINKAQNRSLKIYKTTILLIMIIFVFLIDIQIFNEKAIYFRRMFFYQSLIIVYIFAFLIKNINYSNFKTLVLLPVACLIIFKNALVSNAYSYDRTLSFHHILMKSNRLIINIQKKINNGDIDINKRYKIYFFGNGLKKIHFFNNIPFGYNKLMSQTDDMPISNQTIKLLISRHLSLKINEEEVWNPNKSETPPGRLLEDEIRVDNNQNIIWLNCK